MIMKKIVLTMVALLSMTVAVAQQNDKSDKKMDRKAMKQATPEEMTDRMAQELKLTDAQKAQVLALNKEYKDVLKAPRGPRGPRPDGMRKPGKKVDFKGGKPEKMKDKKAEKKLEKADAQTGATAPQQPGNRPELTDAQKAEMKKHHEQRSAYDKKLKEILNDEQYKSWKKRHGRHHGAPRGGKHKEKKD